MSPSYESQVQTLVSAAFPENAMFSPNAWFCFQGLLAEGKRGNKSPEETAKTIAAAIAVFRL